MALETGIDSRVLFYRITGAQSIVRIEPLLKPLLCCDWRLVNDSVTSVHFVWETSCKIIERVQHLESAILNKLNNSCIIEDKSNLAYLQLIMSRNSLLEVLETYVAIGLAGATKWASNRWESMNSNECCYNRFLTTGDSSLLSSVLEVSSESTASVFIPMVSNSDDWWIVKASKSNCGQDIWILHSYNYKDVLPQLSLHEEYVIQKYVENPKLWDGHKFHFRMYALLTGCMSTFIYEKAFILTAGMKYDCDDDDAHKHITNLSVNKKLHGHPGQIPVNMKETYPEVFEDAKKLWLALVTAASPFLCHQRSPHHFEFFGLDIISDQANKCWLIEVNRLPGLESSSGNRKEEDSLYDEMMLSLLKIVTKPLVSCLDARVAEVAPSVMDNTSTGGPESDSLKQPHGYWNQVQGPSPVTFGSDKLWKNLMNWRLFTRKNRSKILVR